MGSGADILIESAENASALPIGIIWAAFLDVLRIIAWPGILLIIFFFFRRVFAYFLLSLHEINIFGAGIKLVKSPMEVINEMVEKRFENQKLKQEQEELRKAEVEKYSSQLTQLKEKNESLEKQANKAIKLAEELLDDYKKSNSEISSLLEKVSELESQVEDMEREKEHEIDNLKDEHQSEIEEAEERGKQKVIDNPKDYIDPRDSYWEE